MKNQKNQSSADIVPKNSFLQVLLISSLHVYLKRSSLQETNFMRTPSSPRPWYLFYTSFWMKNHRTDFINYLIISKQLLLSLSSFLSTSNILQSICWLLDSTSHFKFEMQSSMNFLKCKSRQLTWISHGKRKYMLEGQCLSQEKKKGWSEGQCHLKIRMLSLMGVLGRKIDSWRLWRQNSVYQINDLILTVFQVVSREKIWWELKIQHSVGAKSWSLMMGFDLKMLS